MLKPEFFQSAPTPTAPTTSTLDVQSELSQLDDETWEICTMEELCELANRAERDEDFRTMSRIQKEILARRTTETGSGHGEQLAREGPEAEPEEDEPNAVSRERERMVAKQC